MGASEKTERGFVRDRSPTPDWVIRKSPSKAPAGILSPNSRVNKPPTRTKHDLKVAARDTNEVELENLQILKLYLQKADSLQKLGHLFSRGEPQTKKLAKTWLASLEDKQLFTELGCQDSCGSTPLIEAVKYRNAELLETYLSRLKEANKKFPGYFSNTLKLHDVAQHTCLTYAMKFYHSVRQEGSLTEAGLAELVLQFCTDVPELLMHQGRKGFTALHILIGHLPNCIRNKETKILSLSEKMVKICPDLLTLTITITPNDVESRELTAIPETPYIFLQRLLKESGIARGQLGAEEKLLDKLMDRIKCVWMRNGYEVGVLYRPGLEPTFALDLTEYSNYQIPYRYLDYFRRSEFENVLRLVSIPPGLEILHSPCNAPCRESACNHGTEEKVKLEAVRAIFHWLKGFNLVRKVLQVNVDDWGHGCVCMDKLIETVLWSYEVEVFNWRRVNITIDTIWKATPDRSNAVEETARDSSYPSSIRKLYLYWAGRHRHRLEDWANQATWELAPQHFPKLESVHITLCMDEEERRHRQPQRISEQSKYQLWNLDRFRDMVQRNFVQSNKHAPEITCVARSGNFYGEGFGMAIRQTGTNTDQTQTASKTPRKPKIDMALTTMHNFARCLETGIEDFCELSDFNLVPTTVAILDDGFNILDPAVKESLRDTPAMSFHPLDHEMLRSGMSTIAVGHPCHGTRMAYVVRQMCPLVKILPIRMRGSTVHDAPTFAGLDAASEAIEWVTELKPPPDIMCMSWTIKVPKTVKKDSVRQQIARLNSALQTADSKGIILFCATSDNGTHENPKRTYPGAIGMQRSAGSEVILRIGAANINGLDLYPGTPADFLFPGEDVPLGSDLGGYAIGSSVATANAAGFTALLLQLRKLSYAFNKSKSGFQHEATRLKTKSIANAFRTLGKEGESKIVSAFRQSVHFYEFEVDDETGDCFARGNTAILEEFIMKLLKKLGW